MTFHIFICFLKKQSFIAQLEVHWSQVTSAANFQNKENMEVPLTSFQNIPQKKKTTDITQ